MPSALSQAGATAEPSEYATLSMDEQFTGLNTQRNPLRDADVPYLYRKFYSASRIDSILDGINREINARLTDQRRAGLSEYNTHTFPAGNSWYSFKWYQDGVQQLRVLYDGQDGNIYDSTANQQSILFTKSAGAGKARFQGVGPTLYFSDGVETERWVRSAIAWKPSTTFTNGQYVVDSNLNLQSAVGAQIGTITAIKTEPFEMGILLGSLITLYMIPGSGFTDLPPGVQLTFAGMTTVPSLNGTSAIVISVINSEQITFWVYPPVATIPYTTETGTATTGTGVTGLVQPAWQFGAGQITMDGTAQWVCRGSSIRPWGYPAPTTAPLVTQAAAPNTYATWAANTFYGPFSIVIEDSNSNVQVLTTGGTTGGAPPVWNPVAGGTTADNTAVWTNKGPATWGAGTPYALGAIVTAQFTYTITSYVSIPYPPYYQLTQTQVTVTLAFQCIVAGTSGPNTPGWTAGGNTVVTDNTVTWLNIGAPSTWATIGAAQLVSPASQIADANGYLQTPQNLGKTGGSLPTWNTNVGGTTADGGESWLNSGAWGAGNTGAWIYAFSGKDSITGDITTAGPQSSPVIQQRGKNIVLQGPGLDIRLDTIVLWRTAQGQSDLLQLDEIPNPGPNDTWIYTDTTPDVPTNGSPGLNSFILAPINHENDPPPSTLTASVYHNGSIFFIDGFTVKYTNGGGTIVGNGLSACNPQNYFVMPEQPVRLKPVTVQGGGLLVICQSNTYIIMGSGTDADPYRPPKMYMERAGAMSYDAIDAAGSTLYGFSNSNKAFSFDPSGGYQEIGFPIGDQFQTVTTGGINAALYDASKTYVTWHEQSSGDTALYVADGAVGWFRWSPVAPPESGALWSPRAAIVGGTSAVQSVEVSPGQWRLLVAPSASGPILMRDETKRTDNGAAYPSWDVKGSIGLCDTGEIAEIAHIALKSVAVGARPAVSLLLDELAAGITIDGRTSAWDLLTLDAGHHEDPPNIEPSITMYSDRYPALVNGECPKCENFQLKIDYGTQDAVDELLKFAVYGAVMKERKQQ